jgi:hypothetical protein
MAITRCNKCAHLQEQPDDQLGITVACPRCGNPTPVYSTLFFVGKLLEKYFSAQREILRLQAQTMAGNPQSPGAQPQALDAIHLSNTDHLACEQQHEPIVDWFGRKQIKVQANLRGVDTTGFFDEVAMLIGANLPVLKEVLERIRWAQQKAYTSTTIAFDKKSPEDVQAIASFCQQLYDFSFVAKYLPNRQKNNVLLALQTAPTIRDFFVSVQRPHLWRSRITLDC